MGLKKNGKKVRIAPHESVDSQDSLEMDEVKTKKLYKALQRHELTDYRTLIIDGE